MKATESSWVLSDWLFCRALHVNERPRRSHIRPSVAVLFFSPFSFSTNCSRVPERAGAALYLARTFCIPSDGKVTSEWMGFRRHRQRSRRLTAMLPLISDWTGAKAAEPNRSTWPIHSPVGKGRIRVVRCVFTETSTPAYRTIPRRPRTLRGTPRCRRQRR